MRIIGGNDYYDSALAYGRDDDILFLRKRLHVPTAPNMWPTDIKEGMSRWNGDVLQNVELTPLPFVREDRKSLPVATFSIHESRFRGYAIPTVFVVMAGKIYPGLATSTRTGFDVHWTAESFRAYLDATKQTLSESGAGLSWNRAQNPDLRYCDVEDFFEPYDRLSDRFMEAKVTTAVALTKTSYVDDYLIICRHGLKPKVLGWQIDVDGLKQLDFQKVVDPWTAFQEISMWKGNMPKDGNPMVEIKDDLIKAQKHGYDKWSFRKMPEGK